jgi:hypothetical protein
MGILFNEHNPHEGFKPYVIGVKRLFVVFVVDGTTQANNYQTFNSKNFVQQTILSCQSCS